MALAVQSKSRHHHSQAHNSACGCGDSHTHVHKHDKVQHCDYEEVHEHTHHHEENCECGHDHAEHYHGGTCGCGHDHAEHHPDGACGCGHDHTEYHHDEDIVLAGGDNQQVFILENLGCANCAAKMEARISELPEVEHATISFATKQLRVSAADPMALLPKIQKICTSIESEVQVIPRAKQSRGQITRVYTVENLDCANCAAKMERLINEMPEVVEASITFATRQLLLTAKNPDQLIPAITQACQKVESEVTFVEKADERKKEKGHRDLSSERLNLITLIAGGIFFVGVEIYHEVMGMGLNSWPMILAFVAAYLILGGKVVLTAVRNLFKGQVFDENFLMSVATIGAFIIQQYPEAVGVMLFFRIGETFEHYAVERSRGQIMDAVDLRPEVVNRLKGNAVQVIAAEKAQVGDLLVVRPGDRIPLDGVVVEGESRIDTSAVTGEPVPVKVTAGGEVVSGCVNTSGVLTMRVEKPLEASMVTRILDSVENAAASKPKIDNFITRFARIYTPIVVAIALFTAVVIPLVTGQDFYPWVYTALSFLVMSCPCALVLSVPLAFFCGIGAGSKKGILFKGGVVMEALANIKAVVMDKTGTITKGNFVVQQVLPTGNMAKDEVLAIAAACEQRSTHPIGISIVEAAKAQELALAVPDSIEEISGKGIRAVISGRQVLCGNVKLMEDEGIDLSHYVAATAGSEVLLAVDGYYAGQIVIADTIKEEAPTAIAKIKAAHILTAMLTGDAQDSAEAVAKQAGVEEVHARLLPEDKLNELKKIREAHGSTLFVGDGINDAPVLAGADVGAAMGSGADAAIEAADVVFMNSNMDAIPKAIDIARRTVRISWQNVVVALAIKIIVMILGLTGIYANMWLAVFADTGVAFLCILNSIRILYSKK